MADSAARALALKALDILSEGGGVGTGENIIDDNTASTSKTYSSSEIESKLLDKVDKVNGKGLSANDYSNTDLNKVSHITLDGDGTKVLFNDGTYRDVNSISQIDNTNLNSEVTTLSSSKIIEQIGINVSSIVGSSPEMIDTLEKLSNAVNNDENFGNVVLEMISQKVDKVEGKVLSDNNYDNIDKAKVNIIKTDGNGLQVLYSDGVYRVPPSGSGSGSSDITPYTESEIITMINSLWEGA